MAITDQSKSKHWWACPPWIFILKFVGLSLIFLGGHFLFELWPIGKDFKLFESQVLQTMLDISHNPDYLPIIVNISPNRPPNAPTDRVLLDTLIRKLDAMQVRAIGIDVDFSPLDNGRPVTPEDWNYFEGWGRLTEKSGLKLHLGVYRRATDDDPRSWLGRKDFVRLAAGIARPSDDTEHNFAYVSTSEKESDRKKGLLPMAVALYEDAGGKPVPDKLLSKDAENGPIYTARYRIDYSDSMLRLLAAQTVDYSRPEDLEIAQGTRKLLFRGKVVLIGDASGFEDQFCRPFASAPTSGVIAHAASLVTLRQQGLQEIDGLNTAWLDFAAVAVGCLLLLTFYFWPSRSKRGPPAARPPPVPTGITTQVGMIALANAETDSVTKTYHAAVASAKAAKQLEGYLNQGDSTNTFPEHPGSEHEAPRLVPGSRLGPYKIEDLIGAGGMGKVYRAVDTRLGREVAIKVSDAQFTERFEREARAVAALNHPNICTLHDVGPNYLVMELVEGTPLKGPLPVGKAAEYAGQILDALVAAHRKGITHRDLKPANILIAKHGVKLLDFGLARVAHPESDPTLTTAGTVMGTPAYMAPEQWEGKPADARSDLYSFGCVLYEMLTGKQAAKGRTPLEPAALDRVIATCLAHDPDDRFQTARDAQRALRWAQEPDPVAEARPFPSVAAGDQLKTLYCILAALMMGLVGLLIVRTNRIFWPDFLWVSAALFIHPFVSETLFPFFGGLAGETGRMLKRTFSDPQGAAHAL